MWTSYTHAGVLAFSEAARLRVRAQNAVLEKARCNDAMARSARRPRHELLHPVIQLLSHFATLSFVFFISIKSHGCGFFVSIWTVVAISSVFPGFVTLYFSRTNFWIRLL